MVYSCIPEFNTTWAMFKHKKFNLKVRNKMRYTYTHEMKNKLGELLRKIKYPNKKIEVIWSKEKFYTYFNKYKEI